MSLEKRRFSEFNKKKRRFSEFSQKIKRKENENRVGLDKIKTTKCWK